MSATSNTYILVINGKPEGPFSIDELKAHNIKPTDFIKTEDMVDYKEAHEIAELRQLFGFSKAALLIQYYGSFDQRLTAAAIDLFFVSTVCAVLMFAGAMLINSQLIVLIMTLGLAIIIPIVNLVYHVIMESSARQGTHGKQLLQIRVCDMEGNRISFGNAAGRNLAKIFSLLPLFMGYLYIFFNKKQQGFHDVIAGTLVIKDRLD
ncbi:RDD family protein [Mucilaginibacter auburnensis]|uniref:Putative RDD family membrane protein YckC n=1 Tax=Mucilaginibacter auburnensis TaxID=1457233 RepID=A0A2H9VP78_9SPHI|nr:RDD family protein [Mucilaginibacter auburnensis]PJJ80135.1 putative RDD family membrane protein YckC [Mucilaginibacter auburnensis]